MPELCGLGCHELEGFGHCFEGDFGVQVVVDRGDECRERERGVGIIVDVDSGRGFVGGNPPIEQRDGAFVQV